MAFGSKDARGIYQYGEDDLEVNHSTLLNLGQESVSDAMKYFSGTPTQRAALTPAPEGATWVDVDTARRVWRGVAGEWVLQETGWTIVMTATGSEPRARYRLIDGMVELAGVGTKSGGTYLCFTLPPGYRPSRTLTFNEPTNTSRTIVINAAGNVSSSFVDAAEIGFALPRFIPAS